MAVFDGYRCPFCPDGHGAHDLPLLVGLWTGQREGDVLRLTWSAYDGAVIRVKQRKGRRKGCDRPAGAWWSPYWCFEHNVERIRRISCQLDEIAAAYERRCAEARAAHESSKDKA